MLAVLFHDLGNGSTENSGPSLNPAASNREPKIGRIPWFDCPLDFAAFADVGLFEFENIGEYHRITFHTRDFCDRSHFT